MRWSSPAFRVLGIGWYFVVCIVGGLLAGLFLDGLADTRPLFTLIGLLLGLAFALIGGYRMLMETLPKQGRRKDP